MHWFASLRSYAGQVLQLHMVKNPVLVNRNRQWLLIAIGAPISFAVVLCVVLPLAASADQGKILNRISNLDALSWLNLPSINMSCLF